MLFLLPGIVYWVQTLFHRCDSNAVFIVEVSVVYAISSSESKRIHTLRFWKFSEWYMKKRIKNASDISYQHYNVLPISTYLWLNTNHLKNFRWDGLSQDILHLVRRWLTSKTKKNMSKIFLKIIRIQNFNFSIWKFLQMSKFAMQSFENFWEGKCPPPWVLACSDVDYNKNSHLHWFQWMHLKCILSVHSLCGMSLINLVLDYTQRKEIHSYQVNAVAIQCCHAFQTKAVERFAEDTLLLPAHNVEVDKP